MTTKGYYAPNRIPSIAGQRFGRLVAQHEVEPNKHGHRRWACVCDCGGEKVVLQEQLRKDRCKSCGCLHREVTQKMLRTHGGTGTGEFSVYRNMIARCYIKSSSHYENYGGRGIRVFAEWRGRGGFERWLRHIGPRPSESHSIDRINNNRDYEPGNVRWATDAQQSRNKRRSVYVEWEGKSVFLLDLSRELALSYPALLRRIRRGANVVDAVEALRAKAAA